MNPGMKRKEKEGRAAERKNGGLRYLCSRLAHELVRGRLRRGGSRTAPTKRHKQAIRAQHEIQDVQIETISERRTIV